MRGSRLWALVMAAIVVAPFAVGGVVPAHAEEDPVHDELRALRAAVIQAIAEGDIERTLEYVHPDIVVTWQNNEVCRGRKGLLEFFERMGKDAFKSYKVEPTPDDLTLLFGGDTGISFGHSVATYELLGKEFEFRNRWTATLVQEDGKWLLASYHVSLNALDNPILDAAKNALYLGAGAAVLIGLLVGYLLGRRRRKSA